MTFFRLLLAASCWLASLASFRGVAWAGELAGRVVDDQGRGVARAVVFVQELPPGAVVEPPRANAVMDQVNKEFVPRVLPIQAGTRVDFPNHDQIHHHVYSFSRTKNFEIPLYKGEAVPPVLFEQVGLVTIGCNIHDWMVGYILVLPTPYFARSADDGGFSLGELPAGRYVVGGWHERARGPTAETFRTVEIGADVAPIEIGLPLRGGRAEAPRHGLRSYR